MTKLSRTGVSLASIALSAFVLAGCAGDAADGGAPPAAPKLPAPGAHARVGSFVMKVRPKQRRVELVRLPPELVGEAGLLHPENLDNLPIVSDGVAGSGPDNTVELVTDPMSLGLRS
jgi:hypothetical protein